MILMQRKLLVVADLVVRGTQFISLYNMSKQRRQNWIRHCDSAARINSNTLCAASAPLMK